MAKVAPWTVVQRTGHSSLIASALAISAGVSSTEPVSTITQWSM
jgi:hypothetical protein